MPNHRDDKQARPTAIRIGGLRKIRRGLSLVEILLVVLLMGIAAGMAITQFQATVASQLQSAAQVVVSELDYARELAVANNSPYRVDFDANAEHLQIRHAGTASHLNQLPASPFSPPGEPASQRTTRLADLPNGQHLDLVLVRNASGPLTTLEFQPLGNADSSTDCEIWLAAGQGSERRYLPVWVHSVTGLCGVGALQIGITPTVLSPLSSP